VLLTNVFETVIKLLVLLVEKIWSSVHPNIFCLGMFSNFVDVA